MCKRGRTPFSALLSEKGVRPLLGVVPESRKQVDRDAPAVLGGRADVVNRGDLFHEDLRGLVTRGATAERRLGIRQPYGGRSHAADRNPGRIAGDSGHDDFRDRLSRARTDLPEPLAAIELPELEGGDQLVGPDHRRAVAGGVLAEGYAPRGGGAPKDDDGVGRGQHRQRVARG